VREKRERGGGEARERRRGRAKIMMMTIKKTHCDINDDGVEYKQIMIQKEEEKGKEKKTKQKRDSRL
jgi:hypothetical protein